MSNLDLYNNRMLVENESKWLDPDNNFFTQQSTKLDYETEKLEEYELSDVEVEKIKQEWEVEDLKSLDKYDWSEILEELVGETFVTDYIVKIDLETNTITYKK